MFLVFTLCPIVDCVFFFWHFLPIFWHRKFGKFIHISRIYSSKEIQKLSSFFQWKKTNFVLKNHFKDIGFGCFLRHPPRSTNYKSLMLFDGRWHTFIISSTCYYVFTMVQVLSNDCILFLNDVHVHTPTNQPTWKYEQMNFSFKVLCNRYLDGGNIVGKWSKLMPINHHIQAIGC